MIACMKELPIIGELTTHDQTTLEACESLIFCLNDRRFVVVRRDTPSILRPINEDAIGQESVDRVQMEWDWPKIGRLRAGDEVLYKGERAMIRAVDRYR
jgi:hypothetical protein